MKSITFFLLLTLLLSCSSSSDNDGKKQKADPGTTMLIDQQGGTIIHEAATLEIPSGALNNQQSITVKKITTEIAEIANGEAYQFGPDGLQFFSPVKLSLPVQLAQQPGNNEAVYIARILDDQDYENPDQRNVTLELLETDWDNNTQTATSFIDGFSQYGVTLTAYLTNNLFAEPTGTWDACYRIMTLSWPVDSSSQFHLQRLHRQGGPGATLTADWSTVISPHQIPNVFKFGALPAPGPGELAYTYVFRISPISTPASPGSTRLVLNSNIKEIVIPAPEVLPPGEISNFQVVNKTDTLVSLDWSHSIAIENHYDYFELKRMPAWQSGKEWKNIGVSTSFVDTDDIQASTSYYYWLRAVNTQACDYDVVTAASFISTLTPAGSVPHSVASLNASEMNSEIVISWNASATADKYIIQRSVLNMPFTTIATVFAPATSYTDTDITNGVTYTYLVIPENSFGQGLPESIIITTTGAGTVCNEAPAKIAGIWSGPYSCENDDGSTDSGIATLTITQTGSVASYTDDSGAVYNGTVCGREFTFSGGEAGVYKENGKFVLKLDGSATKNSTWKMIDSQFGGTCSDSLSLLQ